MSTLPQQTPIASPFYQDTIRVKTTAKTLCPITSDVSAAVAASGFQAGLCTLFLRHTSASLVIQENADPDVLRDLEDFLSRLVPEGYTYRHGAEGPDDMPAHIRSTLTHISTQIPLARGQLLLGTWQDIYLWEHRRRSHWREVVVHIAGY